MKSLNQRNNTIRIAFDLVVYSSITNLGDFVFSGFLIQTNDFFGIGITSLANSSVSV